MKSVHSTGSKNMPAVDHVPCTRAGVSKQIGTA
jgi:hypothetical protein